MIYQYIYKLQFFIAMYARNNYLYKSIIYYEKNPIQILGYIISVKMKNERC